MKPLNIYPKRDEFINGVSVRRIPEGVLPVMLAALPQLAEHVDLHRYVRSDVLLPALTLLKSGKVRPLLGEMRHRAAEYSAPMAAALAHCSSDGGHGAASERRHRERRRQRGARHNHVPVLGAR